MFLIILAFEERQLTSSARNPERNHDTLQSTALSDIPIPSGVSTTLAFQHQSGMTVTLSNAPSLAVTSMSSHSAYETDWHDDSMYYVNSGNSKVLPYSTIPMLSGPSLYLSEVFETRGMLEPSTLWTASESFWLPDVQTAPRTSASDIQSSSHSYSEQKTTLFYSSEVSSVSMHDTNKNTTRLGPVATQMLSPSEETVTSYTKRESFTEISNINSVLTSLHTVPLHDEGLSSVVFSSGLVTSFSDISSVSQNHDCGLLMSTCANLTIRIQQTST